MSRSSWLRLAVVLGAGLLAGCAAGPLAGGLASFVLSTAVALLGLGASGCGAASHGEGDGISNTFPDGDTDVDVDADSDGDTDTDDPCAADADGDGWDACDDCDDTVAGVHPGWEEDEGCDCDAPGGIAGNGRDDDCDGEVDESSWDCNCFDGDRDGDGWWEPEDCNDDDASVNPGVVESCCECGGENPRPPMCDDVDQDCDGVVDETDDEWCCNGMEEPEEEPAE